MSVESTRATMMRYFNSDHSDMSMMADDVVFKSMGTGEEYHGPEGVLQMLHYIYDVAFKATAESRNLIIGSDNAVWEGTFVGRHTAEFAGIPATGKDVRVPLCVVYDLENDQIKRGRIYLEMPVMLRQLGIME